MDFSKFANDKIELSHFTWLGFKNENGALVKEGFNGEIQFYDGDFWFCQDGTAVKKILINKDIDDIYLYQKNITQQTPLPQIPRLTKEEEMKQQKAEHQRLYAASSGCLLRTPHGKLARIYKGKEYDKKGRLICYLLEKENKKEPSKNTYQKSPVFYPGNKCIIVAYIP